MLKKYASSRMTSEHHDRNTNALTQVHSRVETSVYDQRLTQLKDLRTFLRADPERSYCFLLLKYGYTYLNLRRRIRACAHSIYALTYSTSKAQVSVFKDQNDKNTQSWLRVRAYNVRGRRGDGERREAGQRRILGLLFFTR